MGQLGRQGEDLADRASHEGLAKGGGTVHVNPDGSIDIDPASGKMAQVSGDLDVTGTITGSINVSQLQLEDDEQLQFGDAPDYWQEYESANTRWRMRSADVGGGSPGDIARVDDGQQAMDFLATPTVSGTALVQETRTLTGGDGIAAIGDLSSDRTIAADLAASGGIQFSSGALAADPANIDHDALQNFVANEHIDWTADQGATNIAPENFPHDHTEAALSAVPNAGLANSSVTVAGNTISLGGSSAIATGDLSGDTDGLSEGTTNLFYTDERVEDAAASLLTAGSGISLSYDDPGDSLTITNTGSTGSTALFSGAEVTRDTTISVPNDSATIIDWDGEVFDTDNYHSTSTNISRLTVPNAGKYLIGGTIEFSAWSSLSDGRLQVRLFKNGSFVRELIDNEVDSSGGDGPSYSFQTTVDAAANDYFELSVLQASGSSQDLTTNSVLYANRLQGSGPSKLADLSDVALPNSTTPGQLLIWDGTDAQFENATLTGGSNIGVTNNDAGITLDVTPQGSGSGLNAGQLEGKNWVETLVDSPNGHPLVAELASGESVEITVAVPDTQTLKVYRWGVYRIPGGDAPAGLQVQLLDDSDTVQASANTTDNESTDSASPVASHQNSSGSESIFKLRLDNATGSTEDVGGHFAYVVE